MKKNEIQFQKGEYPIKQVIFIELDSVLGSLLTGPLFKEKYGKVDIIHLLRQEGMTKGDPEKSDLDLLMNTTLPVVLTCWDETRIRKVLPAYCKARGWQDVDVRVYILGQRLV